MPDSQNEQQYQGQPGVPCITCGQRTADTAIPGTWFCSLACQLEWVERYYQDYPSGQNPIELGQPIHFANCDECRKLNRV
ncbi:MAG TPA: hypothetical protein VFN02_15560, partial [Ktedonobacteraceae bacterium]|nr:hypothetical protein [Ktedonobacteraceae bacterium]